MQHFAYLGRCCEPWGAATGPRPEDGEGDCVWPPSGDVKGFIWGGELDLSYEYIIGALSGFEL